MTQHNRDFLDAWRDSLHQAGKSEQTQAAYQRALVATSLEPEPMGESHERSGLAWLTPLFYSHVNPYGFFRLDMDTRLPLLAD